MTIYLQLLALAVIVVYIVDVSGFTKSWRRLLARWLGTREDVLRPLPPFDCGVCAVWWACLIWSLCAGQLSLWTALASAVLSLLSITIKRLLVFISEVFTWLFNKITPDNDTFE